MAQSAVNGKTKTRYSSVGEEWPVRSRLKKQYIVAVGVLAILTVGIIAFTAWYVNESSRRSISTEPPSPEVPLPPSPSLLHVFNKAAVCTDGPPCSKVGRDIISKGGSVVDAAVAGLLCNGVVNSQSMGLGGGFIMTIYKKNERKAYSLVARDAAPGNATKNMFLKNPMSSQSGALASGVPGELRGYWEAHKKFGKLPWRDVVEPTLEICRDGYFMTKHQSDVLLFRKDEIYADPNFRDTFVDPNTGEFRKAGTLIKPKQLCKTLEIIADEGGDAINNGSLTKIFAEDIQALGGIITEDDLRNFKPQWSEPITVNLREHTVYTSPPPGSGALLALILNILSGYNMTEVNLSNLNNTTRTIHRLVEAFKYAYARRTELGDPNFVNVTELIKDITSVDYANAIRSEILDDQTFDDPSHYGAIFSNKEDHGTAHISVIGPNGDAVSVTSTINLYFGAGVTSERTGIILNSGMDDFSLPGQINYYGLKPSPDNFIEPGKRPMSSVCPTIIVDKDGEVFMVIGASGGTKIITSVSSVIVRYLWLGQTIKQAVDESRIHHQLYPMEINYEYGVINPLITRLEALGHKTTRYRDRGSIVCALARQNHKIYANADYRKAGEVFGID